MYRNCPELPQIAQILQNGMPNDEKNAVRESAGYIGDYGDLQDLEITVITKEEFLRICEKRDELPDAKE